MNQLASFSDVWLILPLSIVVFGSFLPLAVKVLNHNREPAHAATVVQGLMTLATAAVAVVLQWDNAVGFAFSSAVVMDGVSSLSALLVIGIGAVTLLLMHDNIQTRDHQFAEQVSLLLSAIAGMFVVAWSNDLIVTFIGIELMSLSLYVLIGLGMEQKLSKESAFKYFVLGSFGSAFLLYGVALLYGATNSTMLTKIVEVAPVMMATDKLFLTGTLLTVVGILFKVAIFPFHAWTPDVYQGAPTPITAFMATGVKVVAFVLFARVALTGVFEGSDSFVDVLQWLAVLSILLGNLAALRQSNFKRLLAYSSIAHSGYLLIGILAIAVSPTPQRALAAVLFYLVTYTIMTLGSFAVVSLYEKSENSTLLVDDLKGLAYRRPKLAFGMAVILLSVAGIPPLAGFFAKLFMFSAAIDVGFFWPVIWAVVGSVIGVVYYLRPVVHMYMHEPSAYFDEPTKYFSTRVIFALSAGLVVLVGFAASPVFIKVQSTIESLFQ